MSDLKQALLANRAEIERELAKAEEELRQLEARKRELQGLVERARSILGLEESAMEPEALVHDQKPSRVTLHEAMRRVLKEQGRPMTARELADAVNSAGLYRKGDGTGVEPSQIHARANNYQNVFVRESGRIWLAGQN